MKLKKIVALILVVLTCALVLTSCDKPLEEENALEIGKELYTKVENLCDRSNYEFENFESGLRKRFDKDGVIYYKISNFYELWDNKAISNTALLDLKGQNGLLLSNENDVNCAYIKPFDITTRYDHTDLVVTEITLEKITFAATSYYFPENAEEGAEPTEFVVNDFAIARVAFETTGEDGKTVTDHYWTVIEVSDPYGFVDTEIDAETIE